MINRNGVLQYRITVVAQDSALYSNKHLPELPRHALCLEERGRRSHSTADLGFCKPLCFYKTVFLQV